MGAPEDDAAPPRAEGGRAEGGKGRAAAPAPLPPPASRWLYQVLVASGLATIGSGVAFLGAGFVFAPAVMIGAGAIHLALARHGLRAAPGMDRVAAAAVLADVGAWDEAEALLGEAERDHGVAPVRRAVEVLRAQIAADREGPTEALAAADRALLVAVPAWLRSEARSSTVAAHAVQALAAAELGDRERMDRAVASARAVMVESGAEVGGLRALEQSLAKIALAEALELARSGDREALREHLDRHAPLLASGTRPRERALARALWRTLDEERVSPYRRVEGGAPREVPITSGAPGAGVDEADLARRHGEGTFGRTERSDRSPWLRIGGLVGAWSLAMGIAFLLNFLPLAPSQRQGFFQISMALPFVFLLGIVGFAAVRGRRQRVEAGELRLALTESCAHLPARGLGRFAGSPDGVTAARANLALAREANLAGSFDVARTCAEEGLRRLQGPLRRAIAAPDLLPSLAAERALARAALGDADEAIAEVEALPAAFAHRAPSVFSVRLVALARSGRTDEATELARRRPPGAVLSAPVDALSELLLFAAPKGAPGAAARRRLAGELAHHEGLRGWLARIAPDPLATFLGEEETSGPRIVAAPRRTPPTNEGGALAAGSGADGAAESAAESAAEQELLEEGRAPARRRAMG